MQVTSQDSRHVSNQDLPMVITFDHVGIQVTDADRSARFYEEVLGLKRVRETLRSEPYVQRVVGYYPDVEMKIIEMEIPGSKAMLEILEYRNVPRTPIDPATAHPGTAHFSLYVRDLDALYERAISKGVKFVSGVEPVTGGPWLGAKVVYMKDPDDIRVELVQLPPDQNP